MTSTATLDRTVAAPARAAPVIRSAQRPVRPVPPNLPSPALRLTRRGRLVLVALVAFLVVTGALLGAKSVYAATTTSPAAPATQTVVVQPGQTLWELAEQVAPDRDPRDVIKRISDLNALSGAIVAPGQSLVIPAF